VIAFRRGSRSAVTPPAVRAAGGVVWRPGATGVEICLVHRPRRDDWSLPKGKCEAGEPALLAAIREVAEEADVRAVPQLRLPSARYLSDGLPKTVDYWSLRAVGSGGFQPGEVDGIRWMPVSAALAMVTYPRDREVIRAFTAAPVVTCTVALVRHADAGRRGTWSGPDSARPLTGRGVTEAGRLARLAAAIEPRLLLSASARRCVQTLAPLAELLDLPVRVQGDFDEPAPGQDRDEKALAAADRLVEIAEQSVPAVVCGQGRVLPQTLACLAGRDGDFRTAKGGGWLLAFAGPRLVAADRL